MLIFLVAWFRARRYHGFVEFTTQNTTDGVELIGIYSTDKGRAGVRSFYARNRIAIE